MRYFVGYLDDSSITGRHPFLDQVLIEHLLCATAGNSLWNKTHSYSPGAHRLERGQGGMGCSSAIVVLGQGLCERREGG